MPKQGPGPGGTAGFPSYSGEVSGGYYWNNLLHVAQFLMSNGYSRSSAAGIAGAIAGESAGDPEAGGPGNAGLIQWTPGSKAAPVQPIMTGDPSKDFASQLSDILEYNRTNGPVDQLKSLTGDPVAASDFYSQQFERPAVTDSDVRANVANGIYSALGRYKPNAAYTQYQGGGTPTQTGPSSGGGGTSVGQYVSAVWDSLWGSGGGAEKALTTSVDSVTGLSGIEGSIAGLSLPFVKLAHDVDWLFHPNHWIRILAGVGGATALGLGVYSMTHVGRGGQVGGSVAGVPVGVDLPSSNLPVAIGLTGAGILGLFIAFHNLPDSVGTFKEFLGFLTDEIRTSTADAASQIGTGPVAAEGGGVPVNG